MWSEETSYIWSVWSVSCRASCIQNINGCEQIIWSGSLSYSAIPQRSNLIILGLSSLYTLEFQCFFSFQWGRCNTYFSVLDIYFFVLDDSLRIHPPVTKHVGVWHLSLIVFCCIHLLVDVLTALCVHSWSTHKDPVFRKKCDSTFTLNAERLVSSKLFVILNTISA